MFSIFFFFSLTKDLNFFYQSWIFPFSLKAPYSPVDRAFSPPQAPCSPLQTSLWFPIGPVKWLPPGVNSPLALLPSHESWGKGRGFRRSKSWCSNGCIWGGVERSVLGSAPLYLTHTTSGLSVFLSLIRKQSRACG